MENCGLENFLFLLLSVCFVRERAFLPGFDVLPLRQFGTWGPEINTKFDPQKDTYVLVTTILAFVFYLLNSAFFFLFKES